MADTLKITLVKSFDYRGAPEEWSNSYHFLGPDPEDPASVMNAIADQERALFPLAVEYKRGYFYSVGADDPRAPVDVVADLSGIVGTFDPSGLGAAGFPGDVAATVRWATDQFTSGSHPKRIYLRKYYHSVFGASDPVSDQDALLSEQFDAIAAFASSINGSDPFGIGSYCGPRGAVAGAATVSPWVTTRTLKRRGRRPPA